MPYSLQLTVQKFLHAFCVSSGMTFREIIEIELGNTLLQDFIHKCWFLYDFIIFWFGA